jgi:hypothetical protein
LFVKNGGVIDLTYDSENAGILQLGTSLNDRINLNISDNGAVLLNGVLLVGKTLVSNGKLLFGGNSSLNILQGGFIDIASGGQVGINIDADGNIVPGKFEGIFLDPAGMLFLQPVGRLTIAANKNETNPVGGPNLIEWAGLTSFVLGADILGNTGLVEYKATNPSRSFSGQINPNNTKFDKELTAQALVSKLINTSSALASQPNSTATTFKDASGNTFIILKNGVEIAMLPGDVVIKEEASGVVQAKDMHGQVVLYKLDGTRVVLAS